MRFKKTAILTACCLALAACSGHDRDYYEEHPEEAQKKYDECVDKINKAFLDEDGETLKKLYDDEECAAAGNVVETSKGKGKQQG